MGLSFGDDSLCFGDNDRVDATKTVRAFVSGSCWTDQAMADSQLIDRLHAIRRTVRRRLVAYGVSTVLGGGALSLFIIIVLDWLLWLPAALRGG